MTIDQEKILKDRNIYLMGEITTDSTYNVIKSISDYRVIKELTESCSRSITECPRINLYINSCGGDALSGLGLYDYVRAWEGNDKLVNTIGIGMVASAALIVFLSSNSRYCYPHTRFLIHSVSGGVVGTVRDIEDTSTELKILSNSINELIINRTNITKEYLDEVNASNLEKWIGAEEACDLGICHNIIK